MMLVIYTSRYHVVMKRQCSATRPEMFKYIIMYKHYNMIFALANNISSKGSVYVVAYSILSIIL